MSAASKLRLGFGRSLPSILQVEAAECGLACLAMVAGYHGLHVDLHDLRRRFSLSLKGVDLLTLIEMAGRLRLKGRPVKLDLGDLGRLRAPCILHWDLNHFVVLKSVRRGRISIHDPRRGPVQLSFDEASEHFTGVALELKPLADFERQAPPPPVSIRQLTGPVSGLVGSLLRILLLSFALQVFVLLAPFYLQWVVDQVLVTGDGQLLSVLAGAFSGLLVFQVATNALRTWSVSYLTTSVGVQWMSDVFAHLLRLPMDYFEKRNLGDISSRMASLQSIQRTLSSAFVETILDGLMAVVAFALMMLYSGKLALITLIAVGSYHGFRAGLFPLQKRTSERQLVCNAKQITYWIDSLRGVQSLKLGCRESFRSARYQNILVDSANEDLSLARLNLWITTANQLIFGLERILVVWAGAALALDNTFSVGMLVAYLAYREQFSTRVGGLIDKANDIRMLRLHGERLGDIVLSEPEQDTGHGIELNEMVIGSIEVNNLGFRYAEGEDWVIKNCSFTIEAGEAVAIVGPSGCGKTTLVKTLMGLLEPEEGNICVGGHDIRKCNRDSYRSLIGAVMQDDTLFAGSIAENICFGEIHSDFEKIQQAARLAAVHDDILKMPMGYQTLIGDMGSALSGGQRQRVILARALYRNPKILFLDEATSHLDVARERSVNDAIRQLSITRVIIAHRPETIASASRVLVMDDARIVSNGSVN